MEARIERLRDAMASLTHLRDRAIAQKYIRQLEKEAEKARVGNHRPSFG
jgi:hypothetical protein